MKLSKRLSNIYNSAEKILYDDDSKIILMSDCHRGDGNWSDNFARNQNIYFQSLNYYFNKGYTYIELGDGDELWENKEFSEIVNLHSNVFWMLTRFYEEKRLLFLYGNHDMIKKDKKFCEKNMQYYFDTQKHKEMPLFKGVEVKESYVLQHKETGAEIMLIHGNQGDPINDSLWRLGRFLVRYLWRPLEQFGINDPTCAAKNYTKRSKIEKQLMDWILEEDVTLIAGHTHRPVFPDHDEIQYFNTGSCVHPRCITGIEIIKGEILLVKWSTRTRSDGNLFVDREILERRKILLQL